MDIYQSNFKKIKTIFDLELLKEIESELRYEAPGSSDLFINFLRGPNGFVYKIKLSNCYVLNNALVYDPVLKIEIDDLFEAAEVLTYQDLGVYIRVHNIMSTEKTPRINPWERTLNSFLESWLDEIIRAGYKLAVGEYCSEEEYIKSKTE